MIFESKHKPVHTREPESPKIFQMLQQPHIEGDLVLEDITPTTQHNTQTDASKQNSDAIKWVSARD